MPNELILKVELVGYATNRRNSQGRSNQAVTAYPQIRPLRLKSCRHTNHDPHGPSTTSAIARITRHRTTNKKKHLRQLNSSSSSVTHHATCEFFRIKFEAVPLSGILTTNNFQTRWFNLTKGFLGCSLCHCELINTWPTLQTGE